MVGPGGGVRVKIRWSLLWWMFGFNIIRLYEYSPEELKKLLEGKYTGKVTGHEIRIHIFVVQVSIYPGRRQWSIKA